MKKRVSIAIGVVAALATAAAVLWKANPALRDTQGAHAQQVAQACEKAMASPYFDLYHVTTGKPIGGEINETLEVKARVANGDYHLTAQWETPPEAAGRRSLREGPTMEAVYTAGVFHWTMQWDDGREHEGIYTAGVGYLRDGNAPWAVNKILDHEFVALHFGVDFTAEGWSLCRDFPDAEDKGWLQKVGEETVDGALTTLYTVSQDIDVPPLEDKYAINLTLYFWVDGTGQLVQIKEVGLTRLTMTGTLPGPSTKETKIVGVGETNAPRPPYLR